MTQHVHCILVVIDMSYTEVTSLVGKVYMYVLDMVIQKLENKLYLNKCYWKCFLRGIDLESNKKLYMMFYVVLTRG